MTFSTPSSELQEHKRAVGVFSSRSEAEYALTELRDAGFKMDKVSVIAKDAERKGDIAGVETQQGVGNINESAASGAMTGATMGGITGLIVGLGSLAIPGVGPILLAGEVVTTLAAAAAGAGIGAAAGGLLGALTGLGIPEELAQVYNKRISSGDYLVIVDGTEEEIYRAENTLRNRGIQEFAIYNAPSVADTRTADGSLVDDRSPITIIDRRDANI